MVDYLNLDNPYATNFWNRDSLARHRVVFNTVWELPFGRGRRYLNNAPRSMDEILGGWKMIWVAYMQTGQYLSSSFLDIDPSNTNSFGGLPDRVCNGNFFSGQRTVEPEF